MVVAVVVLESSLVWSWVTTGDNVMRKKNEYMNTISNKWLR